MSKLVPSNCKNSIMGYANMDNLTNHENVVELVRSGMSR